MFKLSVFILCAVCVHNLLHVYYSLQGPTLCLFLLRLIKLVYSQISKALFTIINTVHHESISTCVSNAPKETPTSCIHVYILQVNNIHFITHMIRVAELGRSNI